MTITLCPYCEKDLEHHLQVLNFSGDLPEGVNVCPYCGHLIDIEKELYAYFYVAKIESD